MRFLRATFNALGSLALVLACGTERIELRPDALPIPLPPSEAEPVPVTGDVPVETAQGDGGQPVPALGRDGVLIPDGEFLPPELPEKGCTKIDFLFVIDNSISMRDEQENLARSFPGFVQVMQQVLVDVHDFHMMVVSTSGDRQEEDEPAVGPEECDEIQGAGRRFSRGGDECGIVGGRSYMSSDQPELEDTFACVAQVGTGGSIVEEPIDAMLAATSTALNAKGRCNDGFLRDDAILVVTIITDEEDSSDGALEDWRAALLTAKKNNADAVVLLGLVGDNNVSGGLRGGPCSLLDADGAPRLQEFVDSFGGLLGSVCSEDYAPFFETAVGSIHATCEDFVPPVIL